MPSGGDAFSRLYHRGRLEKFAGIIFKETTAIGLRTIRLQPHCSGAQDRRAGNLFGKVHFKVTEFGEKPEFDDCRRIALETGLALRDVYRQLQKEECCRMNLFIKLLATWGGSGYSPFASGTVGTLAAIPFYIWLARLSLPLYLLTLTAFFFLACWVSGKAEIIFRGEGLRQDRY